MNNFAVIQLDDVICKMEIALRKASGRQKPLSPELCSQVAVASDIALLPDRGLCD